MTRTISFDLARLAGLAAVGLLLADCKPAGGNTALANASAPSGPANVPPPAMAAAAPAPAFQVIVTLSPAAAARIAATGQTITVPAEFYGVPSNEQARMADEGRLDLAPEQDVVLQGAGTANFTAPQIDQSKLGSVEGGQVDVAIDISSGNHTTQNNLLMCATFMDTSLTVAEAKPIQLNCKLIGEP
jgi:hypothetical protein